MNTTETNTSPLREQDPEGRPLNVPFAPADRRALLGASLRLLGLRFSSGQPIFRSDLNRLTKLADDTGDDAL